MEEIKKSRPKRTDVLHLSPNDIKIEEGFNPRIDFGDLNLLASQIESNGVLNPLRGFKDVDGKYVVVDGERRLRASFIVLKKQSDLLIPLIPEKKRNPEHRLISSMVCNEGKKFNPLEEAEVINRLLNYGWDEKDISKQTGKTGVYISNLKLLYDAPKKLKNLVLEDVVSSTLAMEVLRDNKDYDKAVEIIENGVAYAKSKGKDKIVKRDLEQSQGKINSYSAMKKCFKNGIKEKRVIRKGKEEYFDFAQKIINGDYTKEELENYFYEPIE